MKLPYDTKMTAKISLEVHAAVGKLDFFYLRSTKLFSLMEPLIIMTRTWSSYFVISDFLDYMQYFKIRIVVKDLASVSCLNEDQERVCWVT